MASNIFSVTPTVEAGRNGQPDPSQAYGKLFSGGNPVEWPTTLTVLNIEGLTTAISISVVNVTEWDSNTMPTVTHTFGQIMSGSKSMSWPATLAGYIKDSIGEVSSFAPDTTPSSSSAVASSATTFESAETGTETGGRTETGTGTDIDTTTGQGLNPTSSSSPASSSPSHSSGLSPGATAGIAIGCILAGLVIGLIAAFFLFRRKGKRNGSVNGVVVHHEPKAYPSGKGTPIHDVQLNQFLLEATPDRDIAQEVQSIGALIDQHVETYYHTGPINADRRTLASTLAHIGFPSSNNSTSLDAQSAAVLCLESRTRHVGLRHVIMRILFGSIDTHSPNPSMLPAPVASFLQAIPPAESDRFADAQANSLALRKWRNLSAFLLHPTRSQRTSLPIGDAAVALQAQELANSLNSFLRFFAEGQQQQQQQVGHLQAVIAECAKLGYMLFSHPSDWGFVYEVGAMQGVVVEIGLDKLGDRDGAPYPSPRRLVEPVVVSYQSGH